MPTLDEQGHRLAQIADQIRAATIGAGWNRQRSAIASCRVGLDVFRALGHHAEPLPVAPSFHSARNVATDGREGHSIGVAGTGAVDYTTKGWDGHLVLIVDRRWLVDLSADQFSRPAMGIDIDRPVIVHLGPGGADEITTEATTGATRPDGVLITYRRMTDPGDWQNAPDWSGKRDQFAGAVVAAVSHLRATMDVADLDADDYMSCRVCSLPLNTIDSARDGSRRYVHTREWLHHDHDPDPVPTRTVEQPDMLCDFCTDPRPTWQYIGRNIRDDRTTNPVMVDEHGVRTERWMGEKWVACDACDRYVTRGDVIGLTHNAEKSRFNRRDHAGLPPEAIALVKRDRARVWGKYVPTIRVRRPLHPTPPPRIGAHLLPRVRQRLVRLLTERGPVAFGDGALTGSASRPVLLPSLDVGRGDGFHEMNHVTDAQAAAFADAMRASVEAADLYHVSAEFTDLVRASGRDLPDFSVTAEEIPSGHGLLLWERPVYSAPPTDENGPDALPADIIGCSWRIVPGGVWITLYSQPEQHMTEHDPVELRATLGYIVPLAPGGGLHFGVRPDTDAGSDEVLRVILATWFLILQPGVADVEQREIGDKRDRRKAARTGHRLPWVKVVDLRRQRGAERADPDPDRPSRQVTVRFMVRGHWRRQAYGPGRSLRRSMYIAPFIKGPDGAPLKTETAPTVKVLR